MVSGSSILAIAIQAHITWRWIILMDQTMLVGMNDVSPYHLEDGVHSWYRVADE